MVDKTISNNNVHTEFGHYKQCLIDLDRLEPEIEQLKKDYDACELSDTLGRIRIEEDIFYKERNLTDSREYAEEYKGHKMRSVKSTHLFRYGTDEEILEGLGWKTEDDLLGEIFSGFGKAYKAVSDPNFLKIR